MQNPVMYTDPTGEYFGIDDVLAMAMGGATSFVGGKIAGCVSRFVSPVLENIASPVLKSSLLNSISGAASGFVLGTGFSLLHGCDLKTSLIEGGKGALLGFTTGTISGIREGVRYGRENGVNPWTGRELPKPDFDLEPIKPFTVTPDGVVLPKECEIPSNLVENEHRTNCYMGKNENGEYVERIRIDQATPPGYKGPNRSHFHLNGGRKHIFDISKWPYKR